MPGAPDPVTSAAVQAATAVIRTVGERDMRFRREFRALCRELPGRVQADGLVKALVDLAGRGAERGRPTRSAAGLLLSQLCQWLARDGGPFRERPPEADGRSPYLSREFFVVEEAIDADLECVDHAEEDAQRFLRWLKRLAEVEPQMRAGDRNSGVASEETLQR